MSSDINRTQFDLEWHNDPTVRVPTRVLKELSGMRIQLLSILDLQAPKEGHSLQVLADEEWVNWPALKDTLTLWMTTGPQSDALLFPNQFGRFPNGEGYLAVHIEHMIDDYWWVECQPTFLNASGEMETDYSNGPAAAVLRIEESRTRLPYTVDDSPRITSDT